jgi:hypothetical protein
MKKIYFLFLSFAFPLLGYGQVPNSITSNMSFVFNNSLTLSGTRSISNNAIVSIQAPEITINSTFSVIEGTIVTLTATGSSNLLRSGSIEDASDADSGFAENTVTSIADIKEIPTVESVKVYSLTGSLIYFSDTHFDIQSLPLNKGIYILEKRYSDGNFSFEKVVLRK